jgi:hypothetical protein
VEQTLRVYHLCGDAERENGKAETEAPAGVMPAFWNWTVLVHVKTSASRKHGTKFPRETPKLGVTHPSSGTPDAQLKGSGGGDEKIFPLIPHAGMRVVGKRTRNAPSQEKSLSTPLRS